jgi:uncharacterized membrane protein (Fun14 family)
MNEEQYMQKLGQAIQTGTPAQSNYAEKMGQDTYYRDIPLDNLESATSAEHAIPYLEMGSSFLIGMAVGFFIKKSFKVVLFILGFSLIMMFFMESQGVLTINDKVLEESIANGSDYFDYLVSAVKDRITSFQTGVGALAGFVVGLKFG